MQKIKLNTACLLNSFENHHNVKKTLLGMLDHADAEVHELGKDKFDDFIHRLDWDKNEDFNRPWVQYLKPFLENYFNQCAQYLGYQTAKIKQIWFQHYNTEGRHGWHIHGENYTGVYYVKFNKKCAKTELIDPLKQNKKIVINAKEGDIVIFPSYVIHRATTQKENEDKIIVSFNLEFLNIKPSLINPINELKGTYGFNN